MPKNVRPQVARSKGFSEMKLNTPITFVGHSKGGAEAASAAIATNKDAVLFNPATSNLKDYGLTTAQYNADMTAYIVEGDILNSMLGLFSKPVDKVVYLPQQYGGGWQNLFITSPSDKIKNHLMDSVKNALTEAGYK